MSLISQRQHQEQPDHMQPIESIQILILPFHTISGWSRELGQLLRADVRETLGPLLSLIGGNGTGSCPAIQAPSVELGSKSLPF